MRGKDSRDSKVWPPWDLPIPLKPSAWLYWANMEAGTLGKPHPRCLAPFFPGERFRSKNWWWKSIHKPLEGSDTPPKNGSPGDFFLRGTSSLFWFLGNKRSWNSIVAQRGTRIPQSMVLNQLNQYESQITFRKKKPTGPGILKITWCMYIVIGWGLPKPWFKVGNHRYFTKGSWFINATVNQCVRQDPIPYMPFSMVQWFQSCPPDIYIATR